MSRNPSASDDESVSTMNRHARLIVLAVVSILCLPPVAVGDGGLTSDRLPAQPADRADLAGVYLAFEVALAANPPEGPRLSRIQRRFDTAAAYFFRGQLGSAIALIRQLSWELEHDHSPEQIISSHLALHPAVSPSIVTDRDSPIELQLVRLSGTRVPERIVPFHFRLTAAELDAELLIEPDEEGRALFKPSDLLGNSEVTPATFNVAAAFENGVVLHGRAIHLLDIAPQLKRRELTARLDQAEAESPVPDAIEQCRRRLRQLTANPNPMSSAELLAQPAIISAALEAEVRAVELGVDPYLNMVGTYWSPLEVNGSAWPLSIHAPSSVAHESARKRPLVIALHGAGGDEFMFMRAYGAGLLTELAEQHDFLIAAPLTYPLTGDVSYLDHLLEIMDHRYAVDHDRIYFIGHSLGGVTSVAVLNARRDLMAAAACIAGAGRFTRQDAENHPPVRIYGAQYDRIITPESLRQVAAAAREQGLPVEYEERERLGHVLIVNAVLEDAIEWLLQFERSGGGEGEARGNATEP